MTGLGTSVFPALSLNLPNKSQVCQLFYNSSRFKHKQLISNNIIKDLFVKFFY